MQSFAEFETTFRVGLQQERSDLQSLQGAPEAQLSAWIEHLFRQYLGYTHWKEIRREGSATVGSRGSKQLHPDLRVEILDNGIIFVECKSLGRLDGPKGTEEFTDATNQLRSYVRAHVDQASAKPRTVLAVVSDGNRWALSGLNRMNEFHTIAEWNFLTDDPRILAQRMWLLAKPALAQPTSALLEFLARRTLAEVLKDETKRLTKKVNERLPEGTVSEELVGRWIRDAFQESGGPGRLTPSDTAFAVQEADAQGLTSNGKAAPTPEAEVDSIPELSPGQERAGPTPEELLAKLAAMEEDLKPLLALLPEVTANRAKKVLSLYVGKMCIGYVVPRKRGPARLQVYVGEKCPDWVSPHPVNLSWCHIEDWTANLEKVVGLLKDAPHRRSEDMAAGLDAYRRRPGTPAEPVNGAPDV